jgi:hypothetical protein
VSFVSYVPCIVLFVSASRVLRDLIPISLALHLKETLAWLLEEPREFSCIFDATPNVAEAVGLLARKVTASDNIEHRLLRLELYQASLSGSEYAAFLANAIDRFAGMCVFSLMLCFLFFILNLVVSPHPIMFAGVRKQDVLFYNRDRASSNGTAIQILTGKYVSPRATDVPCLSHGLNIVGEHLKVQTA